MNRYLFRAVVAFALGEVFFVLTENMTRAGIAIAVSAFCVLLCILYRLLDKRTIWIVWAGVYALGYINMYCDRIRPSVSECEILSEEANQTGKENDAEVNAVIENKVTDNKVCVYVQIRDVRKTANSYFVKARVYKTICEKHEHIDSYELMFFDSHNIFLIGDRVILTGKITSLEKSSNPGQFDSADYYEKKNIAYKIDVDSFETWRGKTDIPCKDVLICEIKKNLAGVSEYISGILDNIKYENERSIYKGLLLGDKSSISEDTKELFKLGGISHILAISSLHITLVGGLILIILKRLGVQVYVASITAFCFVFMYAMMTGFGIASIRAVVMMLIGIVAEITGKAYDIYTSLAIALAITLVCEPSRITEAAGYLSYSAILGVAIAAYVMKNLLKNEKLNKYRKQHRYRFSVFRVIIFQIILQLIMLPVSCGIYYEIFPYSFILNLIVVPLMPAVMIAGMLGVVGYVISPVIGDILIYPGIVLIKLFEKLCRLVLKLPLNRVNTGHIELVEVIVYYIFLAMLLALFSVKLNRKIREAVYRKTGIYSARRSWNRNVIIVRFAIIFVATVTLTSIHRMINKEQLVFLDVGQGNGIIIRTRNCDGLVYDGGSSSIDEVGRYILVPAIKFMGIANVDYWFVSHGDVDHISGLLEVLNNYELSGLNIRNVVIANNLKLEANMKELLTLATKNDINIIRLDMGDKIKGEGYLINCLYPSDSFYTEDINDTSLVIDYISEDVSALFTGDIGTRAIEHMLGENVQSIRKEYDIVQIPHHGSKNSYEEELYKRIGKVAVISCGENNRYGHPHDSVLGALNEVHVNVWRTDINGAYIR